MFPYCEMEPFRRTNVTTAPFLILIIFRFRKDFEHRKVPLRKVSVLWDQKSRRRIVMPTHFLFLNIFRHKKFSEAQKASLRNVSIQWDKKILGQSWRPPTFFSLTFFQKIISETQKSSSTKCLGTVRRKLSTENRETPPPPLHEIFRL